MSQFLFSYQNAHPKRTTSNPNTDTAQKMKFSLRISSVNETKSTENCSMSESIESTLPPDETFIAPE